MAEATTIITRCPDYADDGDILGCGHEFEAVLDGEGWADCPECGCAFMPAKEVLIAPAGLPA